MSANTNSFLHCYDDLGESSQDAVAFALRLIETSRGASNLSTPSARLTAYDASGAEGIIDTTDFTRDDFYTLDAIERKHGKLPA